MKGAKGLFISFEGIEGSGKSTQAKLLYKWLRGKKIKAVLTAEPGGTAIGRKIRKILLQPEHAAMHPVAELLLYNASRCQHVEELIRPALKEGMIVVCDRFSDSTFAYQGYGRGIPLRVLSALDRIATGGVRPDLTILLDLPAQKGLERNRKARKTDRLELEKIAFHRRVRQGYLRLKKLHPRRVKLIDANYPPEEIHKRIIDLIAERLA